MKIGTLVTLTLLLLCGFAGAQGHVFCSADQPCTATGAWTFTGAADIRDPRLANGPVIDARSGLFGCTDSGTDQHVCMQAAWDLSATLGVPVIAPRSSGLCYGLTSGLTVKQGTLFKNEGVNEPNQGGCFIYSGSSTAHVITKAGLATTLASRMEITGLRLTTTNTNQTGDGIHLEGITNGNYFTRNFIQGFGRNYYLGAVSGSGSDVTRFMQNWSVNPSDTALFLERMSNTVTVMDNMFDLTSPSTGTRAIYIGSTNSSPSDAVYNVIGNKMETNNGASLLYLNSSYGEVISIGNIMRGNPTFNGLGGDVIHVEGNDGNNIAAVGLVGTPVCTNLVNIVQRGFTIPCTATGPRRAFWTGGTDGYGINGFFLHGGNFATDPSNSTGYVDGNLKYGTNATTDMTGAIATSPLQKGTVAALPATCAVGQMYFASDATSASVTYACTATNTWTQQVGSASATGGVFINTLNANYTTVAADKGKLIRMTPLANNVTFTLPATPPSSTWWVVVQSVNTAGFTTSINSSGTNVDGSPTSTTPITVPQAQNIMLWTTGSVYYSVRWSTPYTATTGSLGGGALAAGACTSATPSIAGATVGARAIATASDGTDQDNYVVKAFVGSAGVATVKVCAITAGTPTAKTYNVTVWP